MGLHVALSNYANSEFFTTCNSVLVDKRKQLKKIDVAPKILRQPTS